MAVLTRKLLVHSDGSLGDVPVTARTLPADMRFVRCLHELELASNLPHTTPPRRPEVRQLYPENLFVPFGRSWQLLSKALNPYCTPGNWTQIYDFRLWIANNNGYRDETDKRANYITGQDLSYDPPKVETLTCGGNVLRVLAETTITRGGTPIPSYVVETLDYRLPVTLAWLEARPWLITTAVNMGGDGTPRRFEQGSQPNGFIPGVRHPFVSDTTKVITIPKWRCVNWTAGEMADPYRVYLPN